MLVPWEQISTDPPVNDADSGSPDGDSPALVATCAGNPDLPAGIDERVCGSTPTGVRELTLDQYDGALVVSPSENIVCSFLMLDGPVSATPVTLGYGEVATVGDFACLNEEIGMSCWNTQTQHGIFLSRAETHAW